MGLSAGSRKGIYLIAGTFWALVGIFILIATYFAVPTPVSIKKALFPFAAVLALVFFILGVALVFLTLKLKVERKLKKFLILTGASAAGFLLSVILHNALYGLFIYWFGSDFWDRIGVKDEPFFFIMAVFVCPIGFLVGAVGSATLFIKKKETRIKEIVTPVRDKGVER